MHGRVLDKDSQQPIAHAQLSISALEGFAIKDAEILLDAMAVTSDTSGSFRVDNLVAGTYQITVQAPGHTEHETEFAAPEQPLSIELEGTCQLEGQVIDAAGAPVPNAGLWITGHRITRDKDAPHPRTDAQGRFSLEVKEGTYALVAKAGGRSGGTTAR